MSSEAGGLLLELRSEKAISNIALVDRLFKPLATLNSAIEKTSTTAVALCPLVEATAEAVGELSLEGMLKDVKGIGEGPRESGTHIQALRRDDERSLAFQLTKYKELILDNLRQRFVDGSTALWCFSACLSQKKQVVDWKAVFPAIGLRYDEEIGSNLDAEWNIFRRLQEDLASPNCYHICSFSLIMPQGSPACETSSAISCCCRSQQPLLSARFRPSIGFCHQKEAVFFPNM